MEVAVGVGGAVGGDEQVGVFKIGGVDRRQLDLHRPGAELGGDGSGDIGGVLLGGEVPELGAGAAAGEGGFFLLLGGLDGFGVVGRGLPEVKGDGSGGTCREAVAQAVAVVLPEQSGFAVYHADGAFVAGFGAEAAAIAFFRIDADDFANHKNTSVLGMGS